MIDPGKVSAALVTRGDVEMYPIIDSLHNQGIEDIVIWDNSERVDMGIYGRYAACLLAQNDVVVTQDDDVLVSCYNQILAAYEPGVVTVNYPEPWDIPWVARGAIFDKTLPGLAFGRYLERYDLDHLFTHRICDAVFALLSDVNVVDYGSEDMPHGFHAGRVSTSEGWYDRDRPEAQRRCRQILEQETMAA